MATETEFLRERFRSFLAYLKPKLLATGADLDRLSQLRRVSDVRVRQFALGKPFVTSADLCELLSDGKNGRFDALSVEAGLFRAAHLGIGLPPLGEEMGYVIESCLSLQVLGAQAMRQIVAGFVREKGAPAGPAVPVSSQTLPSFRPPAPLPPDVAKILGGAKDLWVPPGNLRKIQDLLAIPDTTPDLVGGEIERDPPLAAQVLRLANVVAHVANNRAQSVKRALVMVGYPAARRVVPIAALLARLGPPPAEVPFDLRDYWAHSLETAYGGYLAARAAKIGQPDDHAAAGLAHDIGKLVFCRHLPAATKLLLDAVAQGAACAGAEARHAGVSHAAVGACVADRWGFPAGAVAAARHHLASASELEDLEMPREALVAAVLCRMGRGALPPEDEAAGQLLRLPGPRLKEIRAEAARLAQGALHEILGG